MSMSSRSVSAASCHDDFAVVSWVRPVEFFRTYTGTKRLDQRHDLLRVNELFKARLFNVQYLALQRQNRLEFAVAPLLGRAARRVALDDVELAERGVLLLAVGELRRKSERIEHTLAARHLPRLARSFTRTRRIHDLAANNTGIVGPLEEKILQFFTYELLDHRPHF